ncbi:MAG: TraM recognition domain-containing protein, partial [Candidatus Dormiibacterota bacterium]
LGLFLDELANIVPIDDLPGLASQGAGRGVLLMSIVQDLSQLRPVLHHFVDTRDCHGRGDEKLRRRKKRIGHSRKHLLRQRIDG